MEHRLQQQCQPPQPQPRQRHGDEHDSQQCAPGSRQHARRARPARRHGAQMRVWRWKPQQGDSVCAGPAGATPGDQGQVQTKTRIGALHARCGRKRSACRENKAVLPLCLMTSDGVHGCAHGESQLLLLPSASRTPRCGMLLPCWRSVTVHAAAARSVWCATFHAARRRGRCQLSAALVAHVAHAEIEDKEEHGEGGGRVAQRQPLVATVQVERGQDPRAGDWFAPRAPYCSCMRQARGGAASALIAACDAVQSVLLRASV